jgi:tyrosyl-DNA phosphodiesterase 2
VIIMSLWNTFFLPSSMRMAAKATKPKLYSYNARKILWCPTTSEPSVPSLNPTNPGLFCLLSWNVDFSAPLVVRRFQTALAHIEKLVSTDTSSPPTIILLQEVHASCFTPLLSNTFVREFYQVTNISSRHSYSTLTLVPKSLASFVTSVSRIPFTETRMQRDCLYVDLEIPLSGTPEPKTRRVRVANTHLESLNGFGDTARPKQLGVISKLLTASGIDGGLVAGDMNCISPSDQDLPEQVGLSDAWLATVKPAESGVGEENGTGGAEGHTWGYQPKCSYPPRRLDKILTVGKLDILELQRVGVGLKVDGRDLWVSDHYGLFAKVSIQS